MFEDRGYEVIENKTESPVLTFSEFEEVVPDIDGAILAWIYEMKPYLKLLRN